MKKVFSAIIAFCVILTFISCQITINSSCETKINSLTPTKENFARIVAGLTSDATIALTGQVTSNDLSAIAATLKTSNYKINLDLTRVTGLTELPDDAFENCEKLSGISLPSTVTAIGEGVFNSCTELTQVTMPQSIISIGRAAFAACYKLTQITIPASVTYIGPYEFYMCYNITHIFFQHTANWKIGTTDEYESGIGGTEIDVSNAETNATNFNCTGHCIYRIDAD